jgi:CBS domain-containing protein
MEDKVVTLEGSTNVADAVKMMLEKKVWSLVVAKGGLPVGVVTERDVIRRCYAKGLTPERTSLESVMSSPLVTIEPDAPLGQAMAVMADKNIRRVFVVDKGKIVGRITQTGAFGHMLNIMMALSDVSHQL